MILFGYKGDRFSTLLFDDGTLVYGRPDQNTVMHLCEKTRALIVMEAGTPVSFFQNAPVDEHTDLKFVSEDMSHVRLHRNSTVAAWCTCPACD